MSKQKSDIIIIKEILSGKKESFNLLYKQYIRFYMLTCLRYTSNRQQAEDLVQESFIAIFKSLHQYDETKAQFSTWSSRIVINICLQHIRKKNILHDSEDILDIDQQLEAEPIGTDHLDLKQLNNLITSLPSGYRTVFNMYVIDGFTHKEISEVLNISVNTSKSQLMKARRTLQMNLKNNNYLLKGNYARRG